MNKILLTNYFEISDNFSAHNGIVDVVFTTGKYIIDIFDEIKELSLKHSCNTFSYDSGELYFIINVHCCFNEKRNPTEQGGVTIYRYLLQLFNARQDKLKVVFFSPLSPVQLSNISKGENIVVTLLPFIHQSLNPGQFKVDLDELVEKNSFPILNNASENLLSGWAICGEVNINMKGKRILVIDDQLHEWVSVYQLIFTNVGKIRGPKYSSQNDFKNDWTSARLKERIIQAIFDYDLVVLDLYLYENHEPNLWTSPNYIRSISGYQLFEGIRTVCPAIPIVFNSSSNKIRSYKKLDALLCDGYVVKDNRTYAELNDKANTYMEFRDSIEGVTEEFGHCWINKQFTFLQKNNMSKWWAYKIKNKHISYNKEINSGLNEFIDLLKYILLSYKTLLNQDSDYSDMIYSGKVINPIAFHVANIIHNCGRLEELIDGIRNIELEFLTHLRNHAAHGNNYHLFQLNDARVAIYILFKSLESNTRRPFKDGRPFHAPEARYNIDGFLRFDGTFVLDKFKYTHQFYTYIGYYNNYSSFLDNEVIDLFQNRILYYTARFYVEVWKEYTNDEKCYILSLIYYIIEVNNLQSDYEADFSTNTNKVTIKFKTDGKLLPPLQ